ncbi:MAG TPA: hypothetical protein IAC00_08635 [Candidatus Limivicinus faecipullorum]|nr:hypothetical protein [Candidatus Limivicinus faecipullorum]
MNITVELSSIREYMFNDRLVDSLMDAYSREMQAQGYTIVQEEYAQGKAALVRALSDEQLAVLEKAEGLCRENMKYAVEFAFFQGSCGFFQQLFSKDGPERPFQGLVVEEILTLPGLARHEDYFKKRQEINRLFDSLSSQLSSWHRDNLTSVETFWDEQLYGVLRHAFYLGYRRAMDSVKYSAGTQPPRNYGEMLAKLEYELDFAPNQNIPI